MAQTSRRQRRDDPLAGLDRLVERGEAIAGAWSARARASTTPGIERAILRLFGVSGLSRAGRPLADEVVERFLSGHPERLAGGITLPFAMALLEYDLGPQDLALDVAAGSIDLALEAELLRESDRRAVAEVEARQLANAALERIDSDRTARSELIGVLGDAPRPWIGTTLTEGAVAPAVGEAGRLVEAGFDLVRVEVPTGRELARRLVQAGRSVPPWPPGEAAPADPLAPRRETADDAAAPIGSQRGVAILRQALDEAAVKRGAYVRLVMSAPPLAAAEEAVVAAFERVDVVTLGAMAEILGGVDPDRVLADHAFGQRLHRRSGAMVVISAGPLVVAPDLEAGMPSDPATRSGRALALQLLAVLQARADGLPARQIGIGVFPAWLADEPRPAARAAAEVAIRRALFAGHPLVFEEPRSDLQPSHEWPFVMAGTLPTADAAGIVIRRPEPGGGARFARTTRAAVAVGLELAAARSGEIVEGVAASHVRNAIAAATTTLEGLAGRGWRAVLGEPVTGADARPLGSDAVAERTDPFDAFERA